MGNHQLQSCLVRTGANNFTSEPSEPRVFVGDNHDGNNDDDYNHVPLRARHLHRDYISPNQPRDIPPSLRIAQPNHKFLIPHLTDSISL